MTIEPTALYQITGRDLIEFFNSAATVKKEPIQELMNERQVKQHLKEKGYKVDSFRALKGKLKDFEVSFVKELGREKWYKTSDIEAIPKRTL